MTIIEFRKLVESKVVRVIDRDDIDQWRANCHEEVGYVLDAEASTKKEAVTKMVDSVCQLPEDMRLFDLEHPEAL